MTMLAFKNFFHVLFITFINFYNLQIFMNKSHTQIELVWSWNMKSHILFIFELCYVLLVVDFFPRFEDRLGKSLLNLFMLNLDKFIFIWSCLMGLLLSVLLI